MKYQIAFPCSIIIHLIILYLHKAATTNKPKVFEINLNAPPNTRYKEITQFFHPKILKMFKFYEKSIPNELKNILSKKYSKIFENKHPEYYLELSGIAKDLNMDTEDIIPTLYIYELYAACTTVIYRTNTNKLLMGRNTDYNFADLVGDLQYEGRYIRGNIYIYGCANYAGSIFSFHCMKPKKFTITANSRVSNTNYGQEHNLESLMNNGNLVNLPIREAMELNNYQEVKYYLENVEIAAPVYYICMGTEGDEGAVIARERSFTVAVRGFLDHFISQDNSDWWGADVGGDVNSRGGFAMRRMREIKGREIGDIGELLLRDVMRVEPNLNRHTITSSVTDVGEGVINVIIYTKQERDSFVRLFSWGVDYQINEDL